MNDYIIECTIEDLVRYSSNFYIGIYYKTFKWAQFIYNKLLEHFKELDCVAHASVEKDGFGFIALKNGMIYRILKADGTSKGCRNNIVYMEKGIDEDIFDSIILPSFMSYNNLYMVTR